MAAAHADPLPRIAREFAAKIQRVLNTTICNNLRIPALVVSSEEVLVGFGLGKSNLRTRKFPVSLKPGRERSWLDVAYRLCMDDSGTFLTVDASSFAVYAADDNDMCLCHFDYERDKVGYPEAHLQIHGTSEALASWRGTPQTRQLGRLHFPVGGRRFRPTLEDVIEFLVTEELADAHTGWNDVIEAERDAFRRLQLRAAVRRDPDTARQALQDFGLLSD